MLDNIDFELEVLCEAVTDVTLYHGSERQMEVLRPDAINVGTRLSTPRWSVFFWRDWEVAKRWAVFSLLRSVYRDKERRRTAGISAMVYDPVAGKTVVLKGEMPAWERVAAGRTVFVYTARVPPWELGLGHSPTIDEYTIDRAVKYEKRETFKVSRQLLQDCTIAVQDAESMKRYIDEVWSNIPQRTASLLMKSDYHDEFNDLSRRLAHGEIRPGDKLN